MQLALDIRHLKKRYGKQIALNDLNLQVPKGAVMGLVGPNGSGKTTTFAIVAGLLRPDGGSINFSGRGPFHPVHHKGLLTLLPQDAHIPGHSRVRETLVFYGKLQGLSTNDATVSADRVLELVDLSNRAQSPVSSLSHGMIRRIAAAQAFIGNPELVLLDEPTSGLDPHQVARIRDIIIDLRGKQTLLVSSHVLSEIEAACDHVAFIEEGVTVRQDTMDQIMQKQRQISVVLSTPLETIPSELIHSLPDMTLKLSDNGLCLLASFTDAGSTAIINRALLPALLNAGIDIEEVRRGSNLEAIYLENRRNNYH
jgi:ABC-2 type transport system ATP-binding protein